MATLYVTDYTSQGIDPNSKQQSAAQVPFNQTQTVAIGGGSVQTTNALSNNSTLVRLQADTTCSVVIGVNPTATATSPRMATNQTEYFVIPQNSGYKVAVITNT